MSDKDVVYVVISTINGTVETATTDDFKAWALYRDMADLRIKVFISGELVSTIEPTRSAI